MADDKKPDLNLDDWDSIPLDPGADDWDEPPTSAMSSYPAPPPPVEAEQAAQESDIVVDFDIHEIPDSFFEADETPDADEGSGDLADESPVVGLDDPQASFPPSGDDSGDFEGSAQSTEAFADFDSILSDFGAPDALADDTFGPSIPAADEAEIFDPFEQIDTKVPPSEPEPAPAPAADLTAPPAPQRVPAGPDNGEPDES